MSSGEARAHIQRHAPQDVFSRRGAPVGSGDTGQASFHSEGQEDLQSAIEGGGQKCGDDVTTPDGCEPDMTETVSKERGS